MKKQALDKMLKELKDNKNKNIDIIHNYLCDQEDEELFKGILKENKTLKGALEHCQDLARKKAQSGVAVIDDKTVFAWVIDYFKNDDVKKAVKEDNEEIKESKEEKSVTKEVKKPLNTTIKPTKHKEIKQAKGQLNLWEM